VEHSLDAAQTASGFRGTYPGTFTVTVSSISNLLTSCDTRRASGQLSLLYFVTYGNTNIYTTSYVYNVSHVSPQSI
jgi:hypothetical protein